MGGEIKFVQGKLKRKKILHRVSAKKKIPVDVKNKLLQPDGVQ